MQHVIVGDVHLTREGSGATARALANLVESSRGARLVFIGDLFDVAADSVHGSPFETIRSVLGHHEALRRALAGHVANAGELVLLAGNHDDELVTDAGLAAFSDALGLDPTDRALVRASPWFARLGRDGAIHVEHGHHYDPDNALPHPLAPPDPAWWSLGIALMHRFVAPMGAGALVHHNDGTPLTVLRRAFELFGRRAPRVISSYLLAAAHQVGASGPRYPDDRARALGDAAIDEFAAAWGLPRDVVVGRVAGGATPTMGSLRATFLRLYWDRALATAVAVGAGTSAALGGPGRRVALGAAAVLVASIVLGKNRYRGRVPNKMVEQGTAIAETTGARAVVFGHIHVPVGQGVYKNTGSFGFPGAALGRPYVRIDDDDFVSRHEFHPHVAE